MSPEDHFRKCVLSREATSGNPRIHRETPLQFPEMTQTHALGTNDRNVKECDLPESVAREGLSAPMKAQVVELLRERALVSDDAGFQLASGEISRDYIDGKHALSRPRDLQMVAREILAWVPAPFDAVGGLTMGADRLAGAVVDLAGQTNPDVEFFSVRKQAKKYGRHLLIEGCHLDVGTRVLLVDDVVTTGGSILKALEAIQDTGAVVVAAVTLIDRGDNAEGKFANLNIPYSALVTYRDLGIEPVGRRPVLA
jgi:orotate phosphoribosyltransferase